MSRAPQDGKSLAICAASLQRRFGCGERLLINPQMSALRATAERASDNGQDVGADVVTLRAHMRLRDTGLRQRCHDADDCCNPLAAP